jgi:BASS family bile acid:Na+ symporter
MRRAPSWFEILSGCLPVVVANDMTATTIIRRMKKKPRGSLSMVVPFKKITTLAFFFATSHCIPSTTTTTTTTTTQTAAFSPPYSSLRRLSTSTHRHHDVSPPMGLGIRKNWRCRRLSVDPSKQQQGASYYYNRVPSSSSSSALSFAFKDDAVSYNNNNSNNNNKQMQRFTLLTPLWTVIAAIIGLRYSNIVGPTLGSVSVVSRSLFVLMFAMALSTTPDEFSKACRKSPGILAVNAACCFGLMPCLAVLVARSPLLNNPSQRIGTVLLGCVSGGQASNLFALLAGGDVSLSVVCTLSTTLLGVLATPLLVKSLLLLLLNNVGGVSSASSAMDVVVVDGMAVLRSVVSLVLSPLLLGLGMGRLAPKLVAKTKRFCPLVGIGATLLLVAGGAANSRKSLFVGGGASSSSSSLLLRPILASIALPLVGGAAALLVSRIVGIREEATKRTFVVEVLSKSPTLAYVLARKHFDDAAASVPAAAMVTLAVVGSLVASIWSLMPPPPPAVVSGTKSLHTTAE